MQSGHGHINRDVSVAKTGGNKMRGEQNKELKLLPCPFCGAPARVYETFTDSKFTKSDGWNVDCTDSYHCGANMNCEKKTKNGAINNWNKRAAQESGLLQANKSLEPDPSSLQTCIPLGCTPNVCGFFVQHGEICGCSRAA